MKLLSAIASILSINLQLPASRVHAQLRNPLVKKKLRLDRIHRGHIRLHDWQRSCEQANAIQAARRERKAAGLPQGPYAFA